MHRIATMASSEHNLVEMERLQDDVLARLDELNARIEALLAAETPVASGLAIACTDTQAAA